MTNLLLFWVFLSLDLLLRFTPSSAHVSELEVEGSCLEVDLTFYYSTLLHFAFCISPFIEDRLVLQHCIDIIVLNNPFDCCGL
jgi:hypothetical protein